MHRRDLFGTAAALAVGSAAAGGTPREEEAPKPIPVNDLWSRPIIGSLGVEFGHRVLVKGVIEFQKSDGSKASRDRNVLRITHVNGQPAPGPDPIRFDLQEREKGPLPESTPAGTHVTVTGYEGGCFWGNPVGHIPGDIEAGLVITAGTGFNFDHWFVVDTRRD